MNPFRLLAFLVLGALANPMFGSAVDNAALPERLFPGLDQILREAMNQSPGIVLRNLDLEIAKGDEMQAKSTRYPYIGGSVTYEQSRESREGIANTYNAEILNYSFGITQPLWRWKTVSNNAKIGEIRRMISEHQYRDGYRMLAQQIRGGYIDLVMRRAAADQAKFNQKLADDALRLAQDRLAKGAASGGEVFQVDIAAQQARLVTDRTDEDLRHALVSFRRLTGQTALDAAQIPDDFPVIHGGEDVPALLLADFLSQKEPENTDTFVMRQQLESENLNLQVQRKRLYPMFSLVAGIIQTRQNYSIAAGSPIYSVTDRYVGVSASWSVFDGLATRGAVMASQARKRQLDLRYRQLTENLAEDAQRQSRQTELALRQMRISDRLYEDRGYYLQSREQDFKQGTASETDLNAARAAYVQARSVSFSARAAYLYQLGEFLGFIMEDPILAQAKVGRP